MSIFVSPAQIQGAQILLLSLCQQTEAVARNFVAHPGSGNGNHRKSAKVVLENFSKLSDTAPEAMATRLVLVGELLQACNKPMVLEDAIADHATNVTHQGISERMENADFSLKFIIEAEHCCREVIKLFTLFIGFPENKYRMKKLAKEYHNSIVRIKDMEHPLFTDYIYMVVYAGMLRCLLQKN